MSCCIVPTKNRAQLKSLKLALKKHRKTMKSSSETEALSIETIYKKYNFFYFFNVVLSETIVFVIVKYLDAHYKSQCFYSRT